MRLAVFFLTLVTLGWTGAVWAQDTNTDDATAEGASTTAVEGTDVAAEDLPPLPPVTESVGYSYYIVQGLSLGALADVIALKGPGTGDNLWNVSWTPDCAVSMSGTFTLPKFIGKRNLTDEDVAMWESMLTALEAYQQEHIAIGQAAAAAIREARCVSDDQGGIDAVLESWKEKSRELDTSTENGKTVGATLVVGDAS